MQQIDRISLSCAVVNANNAKLHVLLTGATDGHLEVASLAAVGAVIVEIGEHIQSGLDELMQAFPEAGLLRRG